MSQPNGETTEKYVDIFRDMYYFEHTRRSNYNSDFSLLVTIFTLASGIICYFWDNSNLFISLQKSTDFFFWSFFLLACLIYFRGIYFLIRFCLGYQYAYLPTPDSILKDKQAIEDFYKQTNKENEKILSDEFLIHYYTKSSEINISANDKKSMFLHKARISVIFTLTFLIFISIILFSKKYF
jgi:hypothetical protein